MDLYRLEGGDSWVAGRDLSCHILIKDSKVSRRQFEIKKVDDQYGIIDLKSVNGTMVNGSLVSTEAVTFLRSGDCITVLSHNFFFELHDTQFQQKVEKIVLPVVAPQPMGSLNSHLTSFRGPGYAPATWTAQSPVSSSQFPQPAPSMDLANPSGYLASNSDSGSYWKSRFAHFSRTPVGEKVKQNKLRFGLIGMIAIIGLFSLLSGPSEKGSQRGIAAVNQQTNPLLALSEKQQTMVKQGYQLAKNYYMQGRYELARGEIAKLSELIPEYLDSAEIDRLSAEAMSLQEQKRRLETEEKQKAEIEQKIQAKVVECRPLAATTPELEKLEQCLISVLDLNPAHPEIEKLRALVEQNRVQKSIRDSQQAENLALAGRLRSLFQRASAEESGGDKLRAVELYGQVIQSKLPDHEGFKNRARRKVASIRNEIEKSTERYVLESDKAYKEGDLKSAILSLRKARELDPQNDQFVRKLDGISAELRKQMMSLYQEGILEESFGNVEGTEGKQGAKDKWRRILQLDVSDGEYFRKARIKLKKYGAI
jgi:tetratricopeptide (TPR) repeat protein